MNDMNELLPRMGGIALRNGLVLVSEDNWAAAIRERGGEISVASGRKPRLPSGRGMRGAAAAKRPAGSAPAGAPAAGGPPAAGAGRSIGGAVRTMGAARSAAAQVADFQGLPILRGLARFGETLLVVAQVKMRMPQAELPLEGGRVAMALAGAFAATETVRAVGPKNAVLREAGMAVAAFVPAVLSLKSSAISGYHGAEHKVIGGREAELRAAVAGVPFPLGEGVAGTGAGSVAGAPGAAVRPGATGPGAGGAGRSAAASAPKEHERCGSNLVGPLLFTTVAANVLLRGKSGRMTPVTQAVASAVSLGAALEALRWATRHGDSLAARVMMSPGKLIQKTLTTSEPTPDQLEVAERAMKELLRVEAARAR